MEAKCFLKLDLARPGSYCRDGEGPRGDILGVVSVDLGSRWMKLDMSDYLFPWEGPADIQD